MNSTSRTFISKIIFMSLSFVVLMTLAACSNDPVLAPTSITVSSEGSGDVINTLDGTLQMSATVHPASASERGYTWSVEPGTGSARISVSGMLTALTNGTVMVYATSSSASEIVGTLLVTITHQEALALGETLAYLTVNDGLVMGFAPSTFDYVFVLPTGPSPAAVVGAETYATNADVVINQAVNPTSIDPLERTATLTLTTQDDVVTVYTVLFEPATPIVLLNRAKPYVIVAQTGVSTATTSIITGDIALSPAPASYLTGFSLVMGAEGTYATSSQVTGQLFASDYMTPTPTFLTTVIADMALAYEDAASREPHHHELFAGDLSGQTLRPGVYRYAGSVLINTDLTFEGNADDVFIIQIAGSLTMAANIHITLLGGVQASHVFWQVADTVAIGSDAHFVGIVLAKTNIAIGTNASVLGALYAQTAVTLDAASVTRSQE